jgi:hypothetical protein
MNRILRSPRLWTIALLLVSAAPTRAGAQQFACQPIAQGETPSDLARRLTGNSAAVYSLSFQIRDPVRQMFVPKSQYRRGLRSDWQACVATGPVETMHFANAPVEAIAAPSIMPLVSEITSTPMSAPEPARAGTSTWLPSALEGFGFTTSLRPRDRIFLVAESGTVALLMLLICAEARRSLVRRPIPPVLQHAGQEFVAAFARPLIDSSSAQPPVRTRLRFRRHAQKLEISIAPGTGRRYPNLVDHKRNVEYDVSRVMQGLGPQFVVGGRLRASGKWVVVPIRLADVKQTGAK